MIYNSLRTIVISILYFSAVYSQNTHYNFEPSPNHPFGLPNPEAPPQILDFAPLLGESTCKSVARNPDQTWADTLDMTWRFKYIMNGMAVQDETLKEDGLLAGSIRQYIADSARWFVHFYSSGSPSAVLPAWEGNKNNDGDIILYRPQKAPNGMDGLFKINFTDIDENGFNWLGEWVTPDESITYPVWRIFCD